MTALPEHRMTVDEFLAWAQTQPGKYELVDGKIYAMSPERARHAKTKYATQTALLTAIQRANLPCHMLPDGMTVRPNKETAYEPDALVYCGAEIPDDAIEVPEPVIIVEVISPSTSQHDSSGKLAGYFLLPSVQHYLIVDPMRRLVVHHARGEAETIQTRIASGGTLTLDPPGIEVALADMFAAQ